MKSSLLLSLFSAVVPLVAATAPVETSSRRTGDVIPGRFIVQLAPGVSSETIEAHHHQIRRMLRRKRSEDDGDVPAGVGRVFSVGDFYSYSAGLDDLMAADIARLPDVLSVEPDVVIRLEPSDPEAAPNDAHDRRALVIQRRSGWHLGDISHTEAGNYSYVFDDKAGEGNTVYIVDTGIRSSHSDFGGRVRFGINGMTGSTTPPPPDRRDGDGHGTHVASLAAGEEYGVAKKAQLVDCKCMSENAGTTETLLTALTWAVKDIIARKAENTSVVNLSLGKPTSPEARALEQFIVAAYEMGILTVVAAGNVNLPAELMSPAHMRQVITVGMTESNRSRVSRGPFMGSCYGPELDIFAPGARVVAAGTLSDFAATAMTGTSMATPIVAGVVAYLRSVESGLDTPEQVRARIIELSLKDVVEDPKGSPNRLLYNGSGK